MESEPSTVQYSRVLRIWVMIGFPSHCGDGMRLLSDCINPTLEIFLDLHVWGRSMLYAIARSGESNSQKKKAAFLHTSSHPKSKA